MWSYFYNYYLNLIRDNDHGLQLLLNALDQLDLWKNTIVVVTADHGEMAGSHGGLRGKGPFAYELNSHIPLWIVHPDYAGGRTTTMLTSHLDLLPTLVGMTGLPQPQRQAAVKGLPGHDFSRAARQCSVGGHPRQSRRRALQLRRPADHRRQLSD